MIMKKWIIWVLFGIGGFALGAIVFVPFITSTSVSYKKIIQHNKQYDTTWNKDDGTRSLLKQYEIKEKQNSDIHYTKAIFKDAFKYGDQIRNTKLIFTTPHEYKYDKVYKNAARIANILVQNDDGILGWESPINYQKDLTTNTIKLKKPNDSHADWENSAFIWFAGGPEGEQNLQQTNIASNIYGKYGRVFNFRQSQYGFIPKNIILTDYFGTSQYVQFAISTNDSNMLSKIPANQKIGPRKLWNSSDKPQGYIKKMENLTLSNNEALNIIVGNSNLNIEDKMLAESMAFIKVDADNVNRLHDVLKDENHMINFYEGGISYGYSEAINSLLYNEDTIKNYSKVIASSNLMNHAIEGSTRLTGGNLSEKESNDKENFKGESGTMDPYFFFGVQLQKIVFGQLGSFKDHLKNNIFQNFVKKHLNNIDNKLLITYNKGDWNIGKIDDKEKKFYHTYNLNAHEILQGLGHNNIPKKEYDEFMGW